MYLTCPCLAHVYLQDYPSVGQLAMQLEKNNIQPIFAVTSEVADVYKVNLQIKVNIHNTKYKIHTIILIDGLISRLLDE